MAEISKVKIMEVDTTQFRFKPTKDGSKFRELFVELMPLVVKFPKLRIPFDAKMNMFGQSDICMSIEDTKSYSSSQLIEQLSKIDTEIEKLGREKGFLKGFPSSIKYNPILKPSFNSNYPPTIRTKISKKGNDIESVFFDKENQEISFETETQIVGKLSKGTFLLTSIHFSGLYFNDKTWGLTGKIHQAKIFETKKEKVEVKPVVEFLDSSDNESDEGIQSETDF
jgi:hypothetical protein